MKRGYHDLTRNAEEFNDYDRNEVEDTRLAVQAGRKTLRFRPRRPEARKPRRSRANASAAAAAVAAAAMRTAR